MISVEFVKGLPYEYEAFILEKFKSFITTCSYIEIYYPKFDFYYFKIMEHEQLVDLVVMGNYKSVARCFNALVYLNQDVMTEVSQEVFRLFPEIRKIIIEVSYNELDLDKSIMNCLSDDYVLEVPESVDSFSMMLASKTRKHLRARKNKLITEFENVKYSVTYGKDIEHCLIDKIVRFNRERMVIKGKKCGIDDEYKNNLYNFCQSYGCVICLELNDEIVAGCIATIINNDIFLHVIAHDINFSKYNVGEVCASHVVEYSIENKLSTIHFLWGFSELKRRFQTEVKLLYSYLIFKRRSFDYFENLIEVACYNLKKWFKNSQLSDPLRYLLVDVRKNITLNK